MNQHRFYKEFPEDIEYSHILDQAAAFEESSLRMLYVAVFTASMYASTTNRVSKPFNPLLGETFEYARTDGQYRFFTEQVSHHPPISATWTESPKWDFFGECNVDSSFNGRTFAVQHLGLWYIKTVPIIIMVFQRKRIPGKNQIILLSVS